MGCEISQPHLSMLDVWKQSLLTFKRCTQLGPTIMDLLRSIIEVEICFHTVKTVIEQPDEDCVTLLWVFSEINEYV